MPEINNMEEKQDKEVGNMKNSEIRTERRIRVIPRGDRKGSTTIKNLASEWLQMSAAVSCVEGEKKNELMLLLSERNDPQPVILFSSKLAVNSGGNTL